MKVESKYSKKQREIAAPYAKKAKAFKIATRIMSVATILFIIVMLGISAYAQVLMCVAGVMVIATAIVFANFQTNDKKATNIEAVANQIDDAINEYNLSASDVDTIDRIMEDMKNDKYTVKCEDVLTTFTPDMIFSLYPSDILTSISFCLISELTEIKVTKHYMPALDNTEYAFDFVDNKEMGFSIDFDAKIMPDGKERITKLIEEYYPQVKITIMPDKIEDFVK